MAIIVAILLFRGLAAPELAFGFDFSKVLKDTPAGQKIMNSTVAKKVATGLKDGEAVKGDMDKSNELNELTPEKEFELGSSFTASILAVCPPVLEKHNFEYVNLLLQYLAMQVPNYTKDMVEMPLNGFILSLIKNPNPIAESAPGGFIVISTGMIQKLQNEDQLAGVLAHEMGHILKRHSASMIQTQAGVSAGKNFIKGLEDISGHKLIGKDLREGISKAFMNPHSQAQELEADELAGYLLKYSGYSVSEYKKLLASTTGSFLTSKHPSSQSRIDKVAAIKESPRAQPSLPKRVKRFANFKKAFLAL